MEEQSQAERELSEEQLGEISGGCRDCGRDLGNITNAKGRLAAARAGLEHAQNTGNHELAQSYSHDFDDF